MVRRPKHYRRQNLFLSPNILYVNETWFVAQKAIGDETYFCRQIFFTRGNLYPRLLNFRRQNILSPIVFCFFFFSKLLGDENVGRQMIYILN
jgi:hypothetical protein